MKNDSTISREMLICIGFDLNHNEISPYSSKNDYHQKRQKIIKIGEDVQKKG
jgi:hypothetical protein